MQTAAAIVCLASSKDWLACKEAVRAGARLDKRLNPASREILSYLLDVISRQHGYDWRTLEVVATECALHLKTVKRSYKRLSDVGLILREVRIICANGRANKQGRTTIPALVDAALEVARARAQRTNGGDRKTGMVGAENCDGGDKKIAMVGAEKSDGRSQQMPMVGPNKYPLICQSNPGTPIDPAPSPIEGAGDGLIPFDETDVSEGGEALPFNYVTEAAGRGVDLTGIDSGIGALLAIGKAEAARQALPAPLAARDRLGFTPKTIVAIRKLLVDPEALIERYLQKTADITVDKPNAYLLAMAYQERAERDGIPVTLVAQLAKAKPTERAKIMAREVGADPTPHQAIQRKRGNAERTDGTALLAALDRLGGAVRKSV